MLAGNATISVHMDAPSGQTTASRVQTLFLAEQPQSGLVHRLQLPELSDMIWQKDDLGVDSTAQKMPISTRTTLLGIQVQELPPELPPAPTTADVLRKHVPSCDETPEAPECQQQLQEQQQQQQQQLGPGQEQERDQSQHVPHTLSLDHDEQQLLLSDVQTNSTSTIQEVAGKAIAKPQDVNTRLGSGTALHGVSAGLHGALAFLGFDQEDVRKMIIGFFAMFFIGATALFIIVATCQDRTCMPARRRY